MLGRARGEEWGFSFSSDLAGVERGHAQLGRSRNGVFLEVGEDLRKLSVVAAVGIPRPCAQAMDQHRGGRGQQHPVVEQQRVVAGAPRSTER